MWKKLMNINCFHNKNNNMNKLNFIELLKAAFRRKKVLSDYQKLRRLERLEKKLDKIQIDNEQKKR